jgi:hypothetical protein
MLLMKKCPECSAEYDDKVVFCPKDGRTLQILNSASTRLCPHCANSIAMDARECPYCKASLGPLPTPQWPLPEEESLQSKTAQRQGISPVARAILFMGIGAFLAGIFLVAARTGRDDPQSIAAGPAQDREKTTQAEKVQALETELERARQQLAQRSEELAQLKSMHEQIQKDHTAVQQRLGDLKTKYEESQRDLAVTQQRLEIANRHTERLASAREQLSAQPPARAPEGQRPTPVPPAPSAPASPPPPPPKRAAEPGTYETVRATTVFEEPSGSSRALSQISRGTRVVVVRSVGDWLEVRSKHGNPPGYIRIDDAMFVSRAN